MRLACLLALLPCLAHAQLRILDRTSEPLPLLVTVDTDMLDVVLCDDNRARPAVILWNASLKIGGIRRKTSAVYLEPGDPGLGTWFDGVFLPKLAIGFSQNDFCRAAIAAMGTVHVETDSIVSDCAINLTANPDSSRGVNSTIKIGELSGFRHGVLATGQDNLTVSIGKAAAACYPDSPTGTPGHAFYANQSVVSATGEFLRLRGVKLRIGSVTGIPVSAGVRLDSETAKFKGSWNVDYECLDDQNPCGALDAYGSCGTIKVNWKHPGISAQNPIFVAFRCGDNSAFGVPPGKLCVSGTFDARLAPDQSVTRGRWESRYGAFGVANAFGCAPPVVWPVADSLGLSNAVPIGK